jgi:PAS domain S-box-containing protein
MRIFLKMLGYDREDIASPRMRWTEMTPPEWCDVDARAIAEITTTGTIQPSEKELFRKDGSRVPILGGGALFEEGGNEGVSFVLDLSEQKRTDAEIKALQDQLYRENLALRDEIDRASMFEEIVGTSKAPAVCSFTDYQSRSCRVHRFLSRAKPAREELIARAVHRRSRRSARHLSA